MSFLEMLDVVNDGLIRKGDEPIAFDSDCREGICGSCGVMVNGVAHGPERGGTVCQLHMRRFADGETITIEPWRARGFPIVKDLVVDRSAFDRIIAAGGYVSVNTGSAPEANAIPIARDLAEQAMDSAAVHRLWRLRGRVQERVGGAVHLGQDHPPGAAAPGTSRTRPARRAHGRADGRRGLRQCSNEGECEAVCPKEISIANIAKMNREYFRARVVKAG